jgi:hypothetical protein
MAGVIFQTSFDHYTTVTHRFNAVAGSTASISAGNGRNGTSSLRFVNANDGLVRKTLPSTPTDIYCAFALRVSVLPTAANKRVIFAVADTGTRQLGVVLNSDGTISIYVSGGLGDLFGTVIGTLSSFAVLANVYYHFEFYFRISNTVGLVQARVNEVEKLNLTGQDTQATANNYVTEIVIAHSNNNETVSDDYDDIVIRDDTWSGDVEIAAIFADGAGTTTEWTPLSSTNVSNIDETAPDSDTTYNETDVVNEIDLFTFSNVSTTGTIRAVVTLLFAKKTDAGTAKIVSMVRTNSTNFASATEHAPSLDSYEYHPTIYMVNPDTTVAWLPAAVNAAEFGYKRTA